MTAPARYRAYIGTYTSTGPVPRGRAEGIYVADFDAASGVLSEPQLAATAPNPSYIAIHPSGRLLYAVFELPTVGGRPAGAVGAFAIAPESGALTFINEQPTDGEDPCHLVVDRSGRYVLASNYTSGSVVVFPIEATGALAPRSAFVQHSGSGPNPRRQEGPHAHSVNVDPTGRYALVADLGLDRVVVYRLDPAAGTLTAVPSASGELAPGSGPRHVAFHPTRPMVYVINELGSTLSVFAFNPNTGALTHLQTLPTIPPGYSGRNYCADVNILPDGSAVYGSNRGHESLAGYAINPENGLLTFLEHTPTGGREPRGFVVDSTGSFVLAGNQNTDTITVFAVDQATGRLRSTKRKVEVPSPVCIRLLAV